MTETIATAAGLATLILDDPLPSLLTAEALAFEPGDGEVEEALPHLPATDEEGDLISERMRDLQGEVDRLEERADAQLERCRARLERELAAEELRLDIFRRRTIGPIQRRLHFLLSCLEGHLRNQPDKVRSLRYTGGVMKRRFLPAAMEDIPSQDMGQAIADLRARGLERLVSSKTVESVKKAELKKAVAAGQIHDAEKLTWLHISPSWERYQFEAVEPPRLAG